MDPSQEFCVPTSNIECTGCRQVEFRWINEEEQEGECYCSEECKENFECNNEGEENEKCVCNLCYDTLTDTCNVCDEDEECDSGECRTKCPAGEYLAVWLL